MVNKEKAYLILKTYAVGLLNKTLTRPNSTISPEVKTPLKMSYPALSKPNRTNLNIKSKSRISVFAKDAR
jgi:hypothetical protein